MKIGSDLKGAIQNFIHGQRMIAWSQEWEALHASRTSPNAAGKTTSSPESPFEAVLRFAEEKYRNKLISKQMGMALGLR